MRIRCSLFAALAISPLLALAQAPDPAPEAPALPASQASAPPVPPVVADAAPQLKGSAVLKGKRFYIAEYRVLFEVGGSATASTRGGYLFGTDYGATRVTVSYQLAKPNLDLLQAITDQAYADFLARLAAAGLTPEPAEAFTAQNGAVYEATVDGSRAGAELVENVDVGHGKRSYLVLVPTGTKAVSRSFIGIGAGNIGKRIEFSSNNLEAVSVGMAVNLAAHESSGSGSAIFKRSSSANAQAAMEIVLPPKTLGVLQTHARTELVGLAAPMPVPGDFATLRQTGGYDTTKDAAMVALNMIGRLALGVAANNSKKVELALEVDEAALREQALKGLTAVNAGVAAALQ